jgi:uncharacterized protein YbaR (Trm112 family)
MHIVLTDILTCPRCGPEFGLILLAHRIEERRALEGVLGCANCREQYPVSAGAGHFGAAPVLPAAPDGGAVMRLAALLGVAEGPAFVLLAGPCAGAAPRLAALIERLEVVAIGIAGAAGAAAKPHATANRDETARQTAGVNALGLAGHRLPLATGKLAAVALSGAAADELLEEGARTVSPLGRLVLEDAPADAAPRLRAAGLRELVREGDTIVAVRA